MSIYVTRIEAYDIHNRFTIKQSFDAGLNIIYGNNGSGKTTLLHILANILTGDYLRLKYIQFSRIFIKFSNQYYVNIMKDNELIYIDLNNDGDIIELSDEKDFNSILKRTRKSKSNALKKRIINQNLLFKVEYFPAFRTMIEAWDSMKSSVNEDYSSSLLLRYANEINHNNNINNTSSLTGLARKAFGNFVPRINYPSPMEIQKRLNDEITSLRLSISDTENELMINAFYKMIDLVVTKKINFLEGKEKIIIDIQEVLIQDNKSILRSSFYSKKFIDTLQNILDIISEDYDDKTDTMNIIILSIYRDILRDRSEKQVSVLRYIENYLNSVNDFLENKKLDVYISKNDDSRDEYQVSTLFDNGTRDDFRSLSSGERQIITLLYTATYMSSKEIILIDEPEISLHVDWQRLLLKKMMRQLDNKQLIVCTHSPFISADHMHNMKKLEVYEA